MALQNDTATAPLRKRRYLHSAEFRAQHQSAKAFLAPQRDRKPKVQHPKPEAA